MTASMALLYLLVTITVITVHSSYVRHPLLAKHARELGDSPLIQGMHFDMSNEYGIFIAEHTYNNSSKLEPPIGLKIRNISSNNHNNNTSSECFVPFKVTTTLLSMKHLSEKTVLIIALHPNDKVGPDAKLKLVLVNIVNCTFAYAYPGTVLHKNYFIFPNNNRTDDDSFTIIIYGSEYCRDGHVWCRLFFNPFFYKSEPLNFDFSLNQLHNIESLSSLNENLFVVHFVDDSNTYKMRLYDLTNNSDTSLEYKELLSLDQYNRFNYRIISSSLAHCWRTNRYDTIELNKIIHCAAFREDGTVTLNKTVYTDDHLVTNIQSIPNGLVLISESIDCLQKNCSTVSVTVITRKFECNNKTCSDSKFISALVKNEVIDVKHRRYNLECFGMWLLIFPIRISVSEDSIDVKYTCLDDKEGFTSAFLRVPY